MNATDLMLVYGSAAGFATAAAIVAYQIAANPPAQPTRLGPRGYQRHRARGDNFLFAQIEPMMRFFAVLIARIPLASARRGVDKKLKAAGDFLGLSADEYFALSLMGCVGGLGVGLMAGDGDPLFPMAGACLGFMWPRQVVAARVTRRRREIRRGLPPAIDLAALCLGAGLDLPGALTQVTTTSYSRDDALQQELRWVLRDLRLGHTRRHALEAFAERTELEEVSDFVTAVVQAEERGNPLAKVLRIQAEVLRQRRTVKGEEAAAKASVMLIVPLVMLIMSVLVVILAPLLLRSMSAFAGA